MNSRLVPIGFVVLGVWMLLFGSPGGRYGQHAERGTIRVFGWCFVGAGVYLLLRRRDPKGDAVASGPNPLTSSVMHSPPAPGPSVRNLPPRTDSTVLDYASNRQVRSYYERRFDGVRTFDIANGRFRIQGHKSLGPSFQLTIDLSTVSPAYWVLRARHFGFVAAAFFLCVVPCIAFAKGEPLILVAALVPLSVMAVSFRKLIIYRFQYRNGEAAFDMRAIGPEKAHSKDFVHAVVADIQAATRLNQKQS
jgi:hypothetical protein